jgi:hypothetical protein
MYALNLLVVPFSRSRSTQSSLYGGMYNEVMSVFSYGHHVGSLLRWKRENEIRESYLLLAKG